ncbi:MAG: hypothetical protein EOO52_09440 [Gammaproteobacteria bacterium]|nr:MAG: hypothetical protein EOO52_09440 [Gammaproteobacteria bacterium]
MSFVALKHQQLHPTQTSNLEDWRLEIIAANNAFIHGQQMRAFAHYHSALALANIGIAGLLAGEDAATPEEVERQIAAMVVTRHNLADLFQQAEKSNEAAEHLCVAHEALFQLMHHKSADVRALAQRHTNVTHRELAQFIKSHGCNLRIQQSLLLTQFLCECCRHKFHYH